MRGVVGGADDDLALSNGDQDAEAMLGVLRSPK